MGDLAKLPPDGIAVIEMANLSAKERVEVARKAHRKHIMGASTAKIGDELGLNEQTVVRLIDEELHRANTHRPSPQSLARARMLYIIEQATEVLESGMLNASSQNVPQLLRMIAEAQDKLDKYDGNEAPKKTEHVHLDLAALAREAARQERDGTVIEGEVVE